MYIVQDHTFLLNLSMLLQQLNQQSQGDTLYMFPVNLHPETGEGYMEYEADLEIHFASNKTTEIRQLILGADPDIDPAVLDNTINYLIANSPVQFGTLVSLLGIQSRDKQYLIDNGFIVIEEEI